MAKFYEGASADTSDLDQVREFTVHVPPGATTPLRVHLWNEDETQRADYAVISLMLSNQQWV